MAVLAVLIPVLMLGVVLALGRYEDLLLPDAGQAPDPFDPAARPASPPGPAGAPAPSP
ncbi:hypothetical protein ACLGIH_05750 [Streptomyces sp. HMX87]|uniref:hypothetical protein n=1 Tax=Streptomyces sp. HMX87 TaxID=3390849 RepID=UPI003A8387B6